MTDWAPEELIYCIRTQSSGKGLLKTPRRLVENALKLKGAIGFRGGPENKTRGCMVRGNQQQQRQECCASSTVWKMPSKYTENIILQIGVVREAYTF